MAIVVGVDRSTDPLTRRPGAHIGHYTVGSLVAALLSLALVACGAAARELSSTAPAAHARGAAVVAPTIAGAPCAAATAQTAADAAGAVARRIYTDELSSSEVFADRRQVEGYAPLLSALASGNRGAVGEAVTSLVFSHTHIVRLRVSRGGVVVSDVGGRYILAPVSGSLRSNGRVVGSYVLSVQDDSGYVKLESRYIGAPLIIRQGSRRLPVEGAFNTGSAPVADNGPVSVRGVSYQALSLDAQAFPSGPLKITLLIAPPRSSSASCAAVKVAELARIAQRMWNRFATIKVGPSAYVHVLRILTGALGYVRSGSIQLAGSTQPGPPHLPVAGAVRYQGVAYQVSSFASRTAAGPVRVYTLVVP
jgi:hypothetical protein